MKKYIYLILFTFICCQAYSEDLRGAIYNAKSKPLKGIKIWKKNTLQSTISDRHGNFILEDVSPSDTILISVNKSYDAIFPVNQYKNINILLDKKEFSIVSDSVVVKITYRKNMQIRYSSDILVRSHIEQISANDLYELLKGRFSGVAVDESSRQIIIRGGTSFELENEPLFIINGVEFSSSQDANQSVTIRDIEKLEVLKDGSMYGTKGSNGVIRITTSR